MATVPDKPSSSPAAPPACRSSRDGDGVIHFSEAALLCPRWRRPRNLELPVGCSLQAMFTAFSPRPAAGPTRIGLADERLILRSLNCQGIILYNCAMLLSDMFLKYASWFICSILEGIVVDLFADGKIIPQLQEVNFMSSLSIHFY
ncbi:hypothetical protein GUJ93_ZPchr0006g43838 [Zizania palustris]|uniref:Uncharacterized protein n=1 Tax=Zizania palustris TaxID=103762 RepID=A0A8J5SCS3_ZIZPA|nr:hypothetical protein GUJ93_ZPchr0006g43838 [Zizania palustris]KAG8073272.1 hypothetical protein GUJ93_ZPchr0006g43838 [Zizania palustris]